MPVTLALNDLLRVNIYCVTANQTAITGWYYQVTTPFTVGPTDADVAAYFDANVGPLFKNVMTSNAQYWEASCQRITPLPLRVRQLAATFRGPGTQAAVSQPTQVSGLIHWQTDNAGRTGRGRSYLPFPSSADNNTTGFPIAGYQTRAGALATAVLGLITVPGSSGGSLTLTMVLRNRKTGGLTQVREYQVEAAWGTTRRRGAFGRPNSPP